MSAWMQPREAQLEKERQEDGTAGRLFPALALQGFSLATTLPLLMATSVRHVVFRKLRLSLVSMNDSPS